MTIVLGVVMVLVLLVLGIVLFTRTSFDDTAIARAFLTTYRIRSRLDLALFRSVTRADGVRLRREIRREIGQAQCDKETD